GCDAIGRTRDEVIGMAPADYIWNPDLTALEDRTRRMLAGETLTFEQRFRRKDETFFEAEVRGKAFRDGDRTVLVYSPRDVTERKRADAALRESEERFRGTFENAAVGIAHGDLTGRFLRVNGKFCDILGYSRDELLEKTFRDITHPDELASSI